MNCLRVLPTIMLLATAELLQAQGALRPGASGRATSEVVLAVPQTAPMTMPMAPAKPLAIRLDYGQPHLRGRALHTDSLVPYDKPWRLGANGNTMLTTDVDLVIGGASVAKGSYVLYAIPRRNAWTLVVQRDVGQSPMQYSDTADVARIDLRHVPLSAPVESLTMWLIPSVDAGPARGELRFAWGANQLSTGWSVR